MVDLDRVLIVGAGIGGMSAAIVLRRLYPRVHLIDRDPDWRVQGTGITLTGPTLRAFWQLGVYDALAAEGYTGEGIRVCDVAGREVSLLPTPMPPGVTVAGSGGILRPVLHTILSERVRASGCTVRLGLSIDALAHSADGTDVRFSDGASDRYDLVVGADGLFSRTRTLLFAHSPTPEYTGQCIWRVVLPRPGMVDRRHYFLGGPSKVGLSPVSDQQMYLFLLERSPQRLRPEQWPTAEHLAARLAELLAPYEGILGEIRDGLGPASDIVARPLEAFSLPAPWYHDRVILIGDAAHPTTPQLAPGAGMAVEDALVLGEELQRQEDVESALAAFMQRRYERCQLVVRNSLEIGRREQAGASVAAQTELVEQSLRALAAPI